MKKYLWLALILLCSCTQEEGEKIRRYEVQLVASPIGFEGVKAIYGSAGQWPGLMVLNEEGRIYEDEIIKRELLNEYNKNINPLGSGLHLNLFK